MVTAICHGAVKRLAVLLPLVLLALLAAVGRPVHAGMIQFTVDRSDDTSASGCLDAVVGDCSLRGAIHRANATSGALIQFGVSYVALSAPLPTIKGDYTKIDGESTDATIDAQALTDGSVFVIDANYVAIHNLTILRGVPTGDHADISVAGGIGAEIYHNHLGVERPASAVAGFPRQSAYGVFVGPNSAGRPGAYNGVAYVYGNVIGQHAKDGIYAAKTSYVYIGLMPSGEVYGNFIGMDRTFATMANGRNGVFFDAVEDSVIARNTIGNNGMSGIELLVSSRTVITGNYIGVVTDGVSVLAVGNGWDGIRIQGLPSLAARDNRIGGSSGEDTNFICANGLNGVLLQDNASWNQIHGNLIGSRVYDANLANRGAGVAILNGSNSNEIGSGGDSLSIGGNVREGIYISNSSYNVIRPETYIINNGLAGVAVVADSGQVAILNMIAPRFIFSNGGLPIDLGNDGHTANGSRTAPGPNNWVRYPVITASSGSVITGTACAGCYVLIYEAGGNPAAAGGGGGTAWDARAGDDGVWSANLSFGPTESFRASQITMIALDGVNGTSEMSPRPVIYLPLQMKSW